MELPDFDPIPTLVTPRTPIGKPRYPVIDVHQHLGGDFGGGWGPTPRRRVAGRAG